MPTTSGTIDTSTPTSPVSRLACLEQDRPERDRRRHQEREPRRGLAVQTGEAAGRDRDPGAADARDQRERLRRRRCRGRSGTSRPRRSASARRPDPRATGSRPRRRASARRGRPSGTDVSMRSLEQQADDGRRDRRGHEQPGQLAGRDRPRTSDRGAPPGRPGRGGASRPGSRSAAPPACPTWSITLNASEVMNASSHPNRNGTMIRCPDDEIGRNSVSPCTIPITRAWRIRSMASGGAPPAGLRSCRR